MTALSPLSTDTSLSLDDYIRDVNGVVNDDVIEEEVETKRTKPYIIGIKPISHSEFTIASFGE
jgi:hypothetical protein